MRFQMINFFVLLHFFAAAQKEGCSPDASQRTEIISATGPYKYICHILVHRRHTVDPSTAFLISPTTLITAGHSAGEWRNLLTNKIQSVDFILCAYYENGKISRELASVSYQRKDLKFGCHPKFCGNGCPEYDYGYFKLPSDTLYKIAGGFFHLALYDSLKIKTDSVFITGYPSDKQIIKEGSLWHKGALIQNVYATDSYLSYGIPTETGDSGAPIWLSYNHQYYVVGIHNRGAERRTHPNCNGGKKINLEVMEVLKNWDNQ